MKQSELFNLIHSPHHSGISDVVKLEILAREFPFFQSARILLTLTAKKHDSSLFQQTLKSTSVSIPSRKRLHELISLTESEAGELIQVKELLSEKIEAVKNVKVSIVSDEKAKTPVETKKNLTEDILNEEVEKEMQKQMVSVIVEKQLTDLSEKNEIAVINEPKLTSGSFCDWLAAFKPKEKTSDQISEIKTNNLSGIKSKTESKAKQKLLIDKIIESDLGIIKVRSDTAFYSSEKEAEESVFENDDIVTETLARIYAEQGNTAKAKRAYEILSLKFPQKSVYFASLIEKLRKK